MIVERAAALQDQSDESSPGPKARELSAPASEEGMTLREVREIAAAVGVAPRFVEQAARSLRVGERHTISRAVLGASFRHEVRRAVPRQLNPSARSEVLDLIRVEMGHEGKVRELLDSVEWSTVGRTTTTTVALRDRDGETEVQVRMDASGLAAFTWLGSIGLGVLAGGAIVSVVDPATTLGVVGILGAGGGLGVGLARATWSRVGRLLRDRAQRLRDDVILLLR